MCCAITGIEMKDILQAVVVCFILQGLLLSIALYQMPLGDVGVQTMSIERR